MNLVLKNRWKSTHHYKPKKAFNLFMNCCGRLLIKNVWLQRFVTKKSVTHCLLLSIDAYCINPNKHFSFLFTLLLPNFEKMQILCSRTIKMELAKEKHKNCFADTINFETEKNNLSKYFSIVATFNFYVYFVSLVLQRWRRLQPKKSNFYFDDLSALIEHTCVSLRLEQLKQCVSRWTSDLIWMVIIFFLYIPPPSFYHTLMKRETEMHTTKKYTRV